MRKFTVYSLQFTAILILLLSTVHYPLSNVYADDSSPSADLQSKLKQLEAEIASKAAVIKSQINQTIENRMVVGLIQSKTDSQLIITTTDRNQTVLINKFTDYEFTGKVSKTISQDDFVVALGDIDDKGNLNAKRIVKMPQPTQDLTKYIYGQVKDASSSGILITQKDGQDLGVSVNKETGYQLGSKNTSIRSVSSGDKIVAVGPIVPDTGDLAARFVYIYPQISTPQPSPIHTASPSATPKTSKK